MDKFINGYEINKTITDESGNILGHYYTDKYNNGSIYVPINIENVDSVVCCLPGQNGTGNLVYSDVIKNIKAGDAPDYILCFNPNPESTNLCLDVVNAANNNGANIKNAGVMDFSLSGNAGMVMGGKVSSQYPDIDVRIANIDADQLNIYNDHVDSYQNGNGKYDVDAIEANINNQVTVLTVLPDNTRYATEFKKDQCIRFNESRHNSYLIRSDVTDHGTHRTQFIANDGLDWLAGKEELKDDTYLSCQYYDSTTQTWIDSDINEVAPIKSEQATIERVQDLIDKNSLIDANNAFPLSCESTSALIPKEREAVNKIYSAVEKLQSSFINEINNLIYAGTEYANMDEYLRLDSYKLNGILNIDLEQYRREMIPLIEAEDEEELVLYTVDGYNGLLKKSLYDKANLTAKDINMLIEYLVEKGKAKYHEPSVLIGTGEIWLKAAEETGLDPLFLLALASEEGGTGASNYSRDLNDFFGIKFQNGTQFFGYDKNGKWVYNSYADTVEEGILKGAHWIKDFYVENWIPKNAWGMKYGKTTEAFVGTGYSGAQGYYDTKFEANLVGTMKTIKEAYETITGKEMEFISNNGTVPAPTWTPSSGRPSSSGTYTGTYNGYTTNTNGDVNSSTETNINTETNTSIETNTTSETNTNVETNTSTETNTSIETNNNTEANVIVKINPSVETTLSESQATKSINSSSRTVSRPSSNNSTNSNTNPITNNHVEHAEQVIIGTQPLDDIPEILPIDNYETIEPIESFEPINEASETIASESAKGNNALNVIGIAAGIGAAAGAGIYVAKKLKDKDKDKEEESDELYGVENEIPSLEEQYSGFNKRIEQEAVEKYKSTTNVERKDEEL